jgi:PAS domain S-box-containing protein
MKTLAEIRRVTDVPVVIADHQGFITHVNESFMTIFGWAPADILGKTLSIIIPSSLHDAHHLGFSRFLTSGVPTLLNRPLKLPAVKKNGQEFHAEHFIIAEEDHGHWTFAAIIRPLD